MEAFAVATSISVWKILAAAWIRRNMKREMEYAGSVDCIRIYPVKGCGGVSVEEAICGIRGLEVQGMNDRSIMVIEVEDGVGYHRDMKNYPNLVHITPTLKNGVVVLNAPDMQPILLPYQLNNNSGIITVRMHNETRCIDTCDYGSEASNWMKSFLKSNKDIRIVCPLPDGYPRVTGTISKPWKNTSTSKDHDEISFQYFSAYHISNTKSLEDLNTRLTSPVPMDNFRPSITVNGIKAFDEDDWIQIRIGDKLIFRCQDSCPRCTITGMVHMKSMEPVKNEVLKTLRQYRQREPFGVSPLFGIYAAIDENPGVRIRVGDPVYVLRRC